MVVGFRVIPVNVFPGVGAITWNVAVLETCVPGLVMVTLQVSALVNVVIEIRT